MEKLHFLVVGGGSDKYVDDEVAVMADDSAW
jgi:hypothetical protein